MEIYGLQLNSISQITSYNLRPKSVCAVVERMTVLKASRKPFSGVFTPLGPHEGITATHLPRSCTENIPA